MWNPTISFIGSGSDPDGDPIHFFWGFDGDYVFDVWYGSPEETWTYAQPGTYRTCLVVRDAQGLFSNPDCIGLTILANGSPPGKLSPARFMVPLNVP